ncbi:tetratricopeptide repeat (TPR)-like superfamily protein [Tasmannia lanceolata]|uniref:tetratricopeptide repeat (TPR)-like superfamily protein n=1 Tax=Tasmannia lanceolata TaxID=3420 RepID=UPI0040637F2E
MSFRWPRILTPSYLSQLIIHQKNPLTALQIFNSAKSKYPTYKHNGPIYATMIHILGTSNHFSEMKDIINQMKDDPCQCNDSVFANAIKTYAKAGLFNEAIALFNQIPQFNCITWTHSFNTLLQILVSEGKLKTAYRVYLENANKWEVKTRVHSFNILMEALCKRNHSDLALQIFTEMNEQCCFPDRETYMILMKGLCGDGNLHDATHLIYSMFRRISQKGSGADVAVYRILLEALCDQGQVEEAERILTKVLKKGLKAPKRHYKSLELGSEFGTWKSLEEIKGLINAALVRGGVPSLASYSAMIADLYSEGKIEDANRVFDEMRERGFRAKVCTYEAKIEALCRAGRAEEGAKVVEEEMWEKNCVPSVRTYKIAIRGLCKEGKSRRAVGYLERMARQVGCVADKEIYEILVNGLCCEGRYVEASGVLERMLGRRHWPCAGTFNRVIAGLCLVGKVYEAVYWVEEMVSQGKTPEVYVWNSLVAALGCDKAEAEVCVGNLAELSKQ